MWELVDRRPYIIIRYDTNWSWGRRVVFWGRSFRQFLCRREDAALCPPTLVILFSAARSRFPQHASTPSSLLPQFPTWCAAQSTTETLQAVFEKTCPTAQTRCRAIAKMTARCTLYISYSTLIFFHAYGHYTLVCADLILNEFKLWKFCIFLQEGRFDLSRSSKVIDVGANWKRACDFQFLSVRHCNLGPILHRFWDMTVFMCSLPHLYSTLILGVFPLHKIAHVGVSERMDLKLSGREIFFEAFQPMWKSYLNVTDRRTDRQTTYNLITALCVASRGNKHKKSCFFDFEKKRSPTSNILLRMCGHKKLCNWELCVINAYKYP